MTNNDNTINVAVERYLAESGKGVTHRIRLAKIVADVRDSGKESLSTFAQRPEISVLVSLASLKQQAGIFDLYTAMGGTISKPDADRWLVAQGLYNVKPHVAHAENSGAKAVGILAENVKAGTVTIEEARQAVRDARDAKSAKSKAKADKSAKSESAGKEVKVTGLDGVLAHLLAINAMLSDYTAEGEDLDTMRKVADIARKINGQAALAVKSLEGMAAEVAARAAK